MLQVEKDLGLLSLTSLLVYECDLVVVDPILGVVFVVDRAFFDGCNHFLDESWVGYECIVELGSKLLELFKIFVNFIGIGSYLVSYALELGIV